jgi:hypothetical protein
MAVLPIKKPVVKATTPAAQATKPAAPAQAAPAAPVAPAAKPVVAKPAAKPTLPVKAAPAQSTAMMNWEEELAKYAQETSDREQTPSGQFIGTRGGILSVGGQPVEGNKILVIILDHVYENVFYKGKFDADAPASPNCYAFGHVEDGMAPHEDAGDKQAAECSGCPQNEWGTADTGKGKACKNIRRLAIISANGLTPEGVPDAEIFYAKVSVTSVKPWAHYVKGVASTLKRPPFGVITEISLTPDAKTQFKMNFRVVESLGQEFIVPILARLESVKEEITFPYGKFNPESDEAKPAKKVTPRKF